MENWEVMLNSGLKQWELINPKDLPTELQIDRAKVGLVIEKMREAIRDFPLLATMLERVFEGVDSGNTLTPSKVKEFQLFQGEMIHWFSRVCAQQEKGHDPLALEYLYSALALAETSQKHSDKKFNDPPQPPHRISPFTAQRHYAYYCSILADQYRKQGYDAPGSFTKVEQEFLELMEELDKESEEEVDRDSFMKALYFYRPSVGLFSAHLCGADSQLQRPIHDWFDRVLNGIERSSDGLSMFMDRLQRGENETSMFSRFTEDFREDLIDLLSAVLNVANIFAIHAQKEDCAVLTAAMPFAASTELERECQSNLNLLKRSPLYQKYSKQLCEQNFRVGDSLAIPVYVSVLDIEQLSQFLGRFFTALGKGHQQVGSQRQMKIRSRVQKNALAQFNCSLPLSQNDSFSLRIDEERHRGGQSLSLDCGSATIHDAITYAQYLNDRCPEPQMIMGYSALLNKSGGHAYLERPSDPAPRGREPVYYPSVMECQALPMSVRVSLVLSSVLEAGRDLVLLPGKTYSYHHRGRINQPQYLKVFPEIAKKLEARSRAH